MKVLAATCLACLLGTGALVACRALDDEPEASRSEPAASPVQVRDILAAHRFTLATPFEYTWSKERMSVSRGVLVVLEVDPALVVPRSGLEPVLYAGDVPVQRLNHGDRSGRVIGIVPGEVDLAAAPIWFGSPELPERITARMAKAERARAEKAGVRAFPAERVSAVQRSQVSERDLAALLRNVAAELVERYSPQEEELAAAWRLPVAKAPSEK